MKKILFISAVVLLLLSTFVPIISSNEISNNIIYVDDDGGADYTKIQDAIDNASDGDTIYVFSGIYRENLYINKKISLIGEDTNTTIIDGGEAYADVIRIENSIYISNFTIQNRSRFYEMYDGINLGCNNVTITNISFIGCGLSYDFVYQSDESLHNTIKNCTVNNNPLLYLEDKTNVTTDYSCGQIILVNSRNITIRNQIISNLRFGIILSHSHNCYLNQNQITNAGYAILIYFSDNNTIADNRISLNYYGIIYQCSNNNIFMKNIIETNNIGIYDNLSPFIGGITKNNIIKNNIITNNSEAGIWLYSSAFITNNKFISNNLAIAIFWITPVERNNFYSNFRDVWVCASISTFSEIIIDANYWGRSRILPKVNLGVINYAGGIITVIPWFFIDRHPASEPYDIPSLEVNIE